ncbi:unnamed protein product [Phytomonas sp. EM1]|nr:unnamed protein product [Phytomonas sp. EM1]|eukprot:CCW64475.1 unnamed protein product [Phytomonas sp. isolate EM1]
MGCNSTKNKQYKGFVNGTPDFKADEIIKQFEQNNGILFRLVNKKKRQWAYYNDSKEYEMRIQVIFNPDCDIKALGETKLEQLDNGEYMATVTVGPLKTELFIKGRVNGFKAKMDAFAVGGQQDPQEASGNAE